MKSWRLLPRTEHLAKYIECYWFLEKEPHDQNFNFPKLYPDPSSHLIIARSNRAYEYTHGSIAQNARGSHWVFPHVNTFRLDHSAPFAILGVKFKIGALYSLDINSVTSSLDKIEEVEVNCLSGTDIFDSELLLIAAEDNKHQAICKLEQLLSPWLIDNYEDKHSRLVREILPLLSHTPVNEIGDQLHLSQRTTERSFYRVTGLSMKQVQSMLRLENLLNDLYQRDESDINWGDIAYKYRFSDQSHLIRQLKSKIGSTPARYAQQRDLTIDIYGNFEIT